MYSQLQSLFPSLRESSAPLGIDGDLRDLIENIPQSDLDLIPEGRGIRKCKLRSSGALPVFTARGTCSNLSAHILSPRTLPSPSVNTKVHFWVFSDILVIARSTETSFRIVKVFDLNLLLLQLETDDLCTVNLIEILSSPPDILMEEQRVSHRASTIGHNFFSLQFEEEKEREKMVQVLSETVFELLVKRYEEIGFQEKDLKIGWRHQIVRGTIWSAALFGDLKFIQKVVKKPSDCVQDPQGLGAVHLSAFSGYFEVFQYLVEMNCDVLAVDVFQNTCLHFAVLQCHEECVRYICSKAKSLIKAVNSSGCTPLLYGITRRAEQSRSGRLCLEILLEFGADPNFTVATVSSESKRSFRSSSLTRANVSRRSSAILTEPGYSALHICCIHNFTSLCKLLVLGGANPSALSVPSRTPALSIALQHGHLEICKALLQLGACPNLKDRAGRSPFHFASSMEAAKLIIEFAARPDVITDRFSEVEDVRALRFARARYLSQHLGDIAEGDVIADPNEWVEDGHSDHCLHCNIKFSFLKRKHHCRRCGSLVCGECSQHEFVLCGDGEEGKRGGQVTTLRCCDSCFNKLKYTKGFDFGGIVDGVKEMEYSMSSKEMQLTMDLEKAMEVNAVLEKEMEDLKSSLDGSSTLNQERLKELETVSETKDVIIKGLLDELETVVVPPVPSVKGSVIELHKIIQSLEEETHALKVELSEIQSKHEKEMDQQITNDLEHKSKSVNWDIAGGRRITKRMGKQYLMQRNPKDLLKKVSDLEFQLYYGQTQKDEEIAQLKLTVEALKEKIEEIKVSSRGAIETLKYSLKSREKQALEQWILGSDEIALV